VQETAAQQRPNAKKEVQALYFSTVDRTDSPEQIREKVLEAVQARLGALRVQEGGEQPAAAGQVRGGLLLLLPAWWCIHGAKPINGYWYNALAHTSAVVCREQQLPQLSLHLRPQQQQYQDREQRQQQQQQVPWRLHHLQQPLAHWRSLSGTLTMPPALA
jgi:hypothetical protein